MKQNALKGFGRLAIVFVLHLTLIPVAFGESELETAKRFAPALKFDRAHKGLPMSAQVYFETILNPVVNKPRKGLITWTTPWDGPCGKPGVIRIRGRDESNCGMENTNFQTLKNGQVPTYFRFISADNGRLRIAYWWFYGFQRHCNPSKCTGAAGEHHGDWENILVTTTPDRSQVDYVTYNFHGDWYTRKNGGFETYDDRPVVYVGKLGHGCYHGQELSGWMTGTPHQCCQYADFRNPVSQSVWTNTYDNLVNLDENSEPWMLADRIGSLYEHNGKKYKIESWRWGPHISYKGWWCKWEHVKACSNHPTVAKLDWSIKSCEGVGCGTRHCEGLVYTRNADFNQPWPSKLDRP